MFDLIGFWFVVSLITILLIHPFIFIAKPLVNHLVSQITDDKDRGQKASDWLWDSDYRRCNRSVYFKRYNFPDVLVFLTTLVGVLSWLGYLISIPARAEAFLPPLSLVDVVSKISIAVSPVMGYVGIFFLIYTGIILLGRQFWKLKVKVDEVIEKTSN